MQGLESGVRSHYSSKGKVGVRVKRTKIRVVIQPHRWPRTGVQCVDSRAKLCV